jgi:hypothetical protein
MGLARALQYFRAELATLGSPLAMHAANPHVSGADSLLIFCALSGEGAISECAGGRPY